ncbi:MAG: type II toxin-antitoxin system VapC family toxin [Bryobacteraceae bacterium]|nr:type II toxin-antitoxin system VapC family toxin [Bryobacteraceae bacterium]
MKVLLDTHTLLWWTLNDPRLSPKAAALLSSFQTDAFVSAATAWEIATKFRLGKLLNVGSFANDFGVRIAQLGFRELAVTVEHGQRAGLLPGDHRDPFDRMLVAQAQAENMPIVSNEKIFDQYHVRRIW